MRISVNCGQFQEAMVDGGGAGSRVPVMMLSFGAGALHFETRHLSYSIPAEGDWKEDVIVPMGGARKLDGKPFEVDPLTLRVERGRLFAESFSAPCVSEAAFRENLHLAERLSEGANSDVFESSPEWGREWLFPE